MSLLIDTNVSFGPASRVAWLKLLNGAGGTLPIPRGEAVDLIQVEHQREAVDERLRRERDKRFVAHRIASAVVLAGITRTLPGGG